MTREIYTEEHDIFRDAFRKFLEKETVPHREEWIKAGIVPREIWKKTGEQGFIAPWLPNVVRVGRPIFDLAHLLLLLPNAEGQARCKTSPSPSCWPSALNPSWKATVPCGVCPSKDRAKKTSCGAPSCISPGMFLNPNFL
jgi:hypothetical protein